MQCMCSGPARRKPPAASCTAAGKSTPLPAPAPWSQLSTKLIDSGKLRDSLKLTYDFMNRNGDNRRDSASSTAVTACGGGLPTGRRAAMMVYPCMTHAGHRVRSLR